MIDKSYMPQLRAEKTTKNRDDLRVMIAGVFLCIFLLLTQSGFSRLHDAFIAERPFVTATVELYHVDDSLPPLVRYDADANQPAQGIWIASIYDANGTRLNSRRGTGNYNNNDDDPKFWSWSAWFDNESSNPPSVPSIPFYVCVRYDVTANDSGVDDSTDRYCSQVYDKDNPLFQIDDILNMEITQ